MTFDQFKLEVNQILIDKYGITWDDACGDIWVLHNYFKFDGENPNDFVQWFADKYDLELLEAQ